MEISHQKLDNPHDQHNQADDMSTFDHTIPDFVGADLFTLHQKSCQWRIHQYISIPFQHDQ